MCGIVLSFTPRRPTPLASVEAMTRRLRHRGPDDEGYLLWDAAADSTPLLLAGDDTPAAVRTFLTPWRPDAAVSDAADRHATLQFGHRRLSIVDLSPWGHQPMRRGARFVVFNGEIYNHVELRAELEAAGLAFEGHSDTEVLLGAIEHWGLPQALARCNGMWAFVLLDITRRRLVLARDRFGVKPLYLWRGDGGALVAASEVKALLDHPQVCAAPNLERAIAFVQRGPSAWQEQTEFAGITRFPPGHVAELSIDAPDGAFEPQPFWHPSAPADEAEPFDVNRAERLAGRYRALLDDAVRVRLRADVRVGTALSGGLDSSSIALLVSAELKRRGGAERQEVFSSVYPARGRGPGAAALREADESAFIDRVARRLHVRSNTVEPRGADVLSSHEAIAWALDTPAANTLMSSWHTFALVRRRGVVVTLDGQGADEQLAGYSRYVRNRLVHAPIGSALKDAAALVRRHEGFASAVAIGLGGHLVRRVAGVDALSSLARRLGMGADPSPTLGAVLASDFSTHLQNLLHYADKTSMAWSVESRMPFMDWRLVEFLASSVAPAYKVHAGWTKWLARRAFDGQLPDEVTWRRDKMGWAVPERAWFDGAAGQLGAWLQHRIDASDFALDIADRAGVRLGRDAPLAGRLRVLNLATWHRLYFEEPNRPGRALGRDAGAAGAAAVGAPVTA